MGLLEEYEKIYNTYVKIYGEKIAVLMRKGDFFNFYGVDCGTDKMGNITEICGVTGLQRTRKNGNFLESGTRKNPFMAGFPHHQLERYVNILAEKRYYVVVVDQTTPPPRCKREVVDIIGPGTSKYTKSVSNYLFSLYLEPEGKRKMVTIGISAIDVLTGKIIVFETWNTEQDENHALDEACRMIRALTPKEILISSRNIDGNEQKRITKYLSLSKIVTRFIDINPNIYKPDYQNHFLKKYFHGETMLTTVEFIGMEKIATAVISLMVLLEECKIRNESVLVNLSIPFVWEMSKHLILDSTCIDQLNLVSSKKSGTKLASIINLLDYTSTAMGKRLFRSRIISPITDPKLINKRYEYVGKLENYGNFEEILIHIKDLEKLHRKLIIGSLQPCEFYHLHSSYEYFIKLLEIMKTTEVRELIPRDFEPKFKDFMDHYGSVLRVNWLADGDIIPLVENFPEVNELYEKKTILDNLFFKLADDISSTIIGRFGAAHHEYSEEFGHFISMTAHRYKTLKRSKRPLKFNEEEIPIESLREISAKATVKFTSPILIKYSNELDKLSATYNASTKNIYAELLKELSAYKDVLSQAERIVAVVDVYVSTAKSSKLLKLVRPIIDSTKEGPSYIEAYDLRHPIIEKMDLDFEYVPQTIILKDQSRGMLLYGPNSAGKSSSMKAIGIALVLAQAGMYVPSSKFVYKPYKTILTRIIGNDDIFRGLSSFAVEMSELRGILRRANANSLVLGDEVCHGTETTSAVCLVAAALKYLSSLQSTFLFATHLHQLSKMQIVKDVPNLSLFHLNVKALDTGEIIYDRLLTSGPGLSTYGIEIAKAMGLPPDFIDGALQIRETLDAPLPKKSKYNSKVFVDICKICGNKATDTHHIKFQSEADVQGFIGTMHKNSKANLIGLCKICHDKIHDKKLTIQGYKLTTKGVKLSVT